VRTLSIDEMTGIQALERLAPSLAMKPGQVERREFQYKRHGTQTLIAAFDVATGSLQGAVGESRTEADFAAFLDARLGEGAPDQQWRIVCDNLNIHLSEGVVRLVARHCAIECKRAYCLRGFQFLVRQTLQPIFVSDWENAALVEERESGWAEFEHSEKERENLESKWHSLWELDCPVCRTLDSLCVDLVLEDDYHSPVGVDKAICMDCGFYIGPDRAEPYHAKVLLNDQLVEQDRKIKSEFGIER